MEELFLPNILLIAGTGRNSGKTTFACSVIRRLSDQVPIVSVKITPHRHSETGRLITLLRTEDIYIAEETDPAAPKDSSRMLAAGANRSFLIMAGDDKLPEVWEFLLPMIGSDESIVCESGGTRNFIKPGLFLMIESSGNKELKEESVKFRELCDRWITFNGENFDFSPGSVTIQNNKWVINEY